MDPISITTGIISLTTATAKLTKDLFALSEVLQSTNAAQEVQFYTLLLSELSDVTLKNVEVSPSTSAAAKLCHERLVDLQDAVSAAKPNAKAIRAELSSFQGSIMLLREMVMESDFPTADDLGETRTDTIL